MQRSTMATVVAGVLMSAAMIQAARGEPPSSPFGYAVFAIGDVTLRNGVRAIDGDVGSNNGNAVVGQNVRVAGSVVGRTITLRKGALADSLFCLLLQGKSFLSCQAITFPLVSPTQLPPVQVVAGTMKIKIPKNGSTSPIPAGAYGQLQIKSGGILVLAGGSYVFKSIQVASTGQLLCSAPCEVGVAGSVEVQSNAMLGGTDGTRAEAVRVNVAQTSKGTVFSAAKRSTVSAVVYAPGGGITLGQRGNFVGAFVGSSVSVGKNALVQARSS